MARNESYVTNNGAPQQGPPRGNDLRCLAPSEAVGYYHHTFARRAQRGDVAFRSERRHRGRTAGFVSSGVTQMDYRIISADCHIDMTWMPGDLWVKNAPAKLHEQVPQVRETPDGPHWFAEGKDLGVFGGLGFGFDRVQRGYSKHVDKMFEVGFYEGGPHPTTPELRLEDQQLDGIDAEVMYGILGIGMRMTDRELIQVVYEIYNDWAADFCKTNPQRFVGLACIPNHDPDAAAKELRRQASISGARSSRRSSMIRSGSRRGNSSGPRTSCGPPIIPIPSRRGRIPARSSRGTSRVFPKTKSA